MHWSHLQKTLTLKLDHLWFEANHWLLATIIWNDQFKLVPHFIDDASIVKCEWTVYTYMPIHISQDRCTPTWLLGLSDLQFKSNWNENSYCLCFVRPDVTLTGPMVRNKGSLDQVMLTFTLLYFHSFFTFFIISIEKHVLVLTRTPYVFFAWEGR